MASLQKQTKWGLSLIHISSGASLPYISFGSSEIRDVLLCSTSFLYWAEGSKAPESKAISQVPALFSPDSDYAHIYQFAVLDLDGDGGSEVVLEISAVASDMGGYLVLRQVGGTVYGYPSGWRTFWYLKADGTFVYSYQAGNEDGAASVRFTGTSMELEDVYKRQPWSLSPLFRACPPSVSETV